MVRTPQLSDAEWKVMNAVWAHGRGVTARNVLEAVADETGWAYTTVKTMMDRLVDKDVLVGRRDGNTTTYTARLTRGAARRRAAESLLHKAFDGAAGPLVHYLVSQEELSPDEREELRRMLQEQEAADEAQRSGAARKSGPHNAGSRGDTP